MEVANLLVYIQIALTLLLALVLVAIIKRVFRKSLENRRSARKAGPLLWHHELTGRLFAKSFQMSETRHRILARVLQAFVILIAVGVVVYMVPPLRALSYSLLAGAGIAAIIIGFAVQKSFANIFAGIFIGIYEPFRIGDFISIGERYGVVEDITLHHTVIREWRNRRYIIPNSIISDETIQNHTISTPRVFKTFEIGISYDSDVDLARKIILEEVNKHPSLLVPEEKVDNKLTKQEPSVRVIDWADFAIKLRVGFWVEHPFIGYTMKFDLLESIKKRFAKEGVEIPYPYRTIVYKKDMKRPTKRRSARRR